MFFKEVGGKGSGIYFFFEKKKADHIISFLITFIFARILRMADKPVKRETSISQKIRTSPANLLHDLRGLIASARQEVARQVNSSLVMLYWRVGQRIRKDILKERRAEYGERIVVTLSRQLSQEFGPGWSRRNLFNMVRFADVFDDQKIVHALSAQLGWTHFRHIIYLDDKIKRDFTKTLPQVL